MSRLDRDPEDQLAVRLRALGETLDELRRPQTFGAANVRVYRIFKTGGGSDVTLANLNTTPRCIEVTLTSSSPVSNPSIAFDWAFTAAFSPSYGVYYSSAVLPPVGNTQKFRAYLQVATPGVSVNADIRFTFFTISSATYSAVEIPV